MSSKSKPLLFIDVDGVLNPDVLQESYTTYTFRIMGGKFKVYLNPEHGKWITELAERTNSELVWCTMWEWNAQNDIAPILGLPDMPYVPILPAKMSSPIEWDKAYSAEKYANGRKFVILDDLDLEFYFENKNSYQVHVNPYTGLTLDDIDKAEALLVNLVLPTCVVCGSQDSIHEGNCFPVIAR